MSKKINELFSSQEYDRVIEQTKNSSDISELFLRAQSFTLLGDYSNAIKTIELNEKILARDLSKLIDLHMNICFAFGYYGDAQKALNHYNEYPYVSQEVEEKFIKYQDIIEKMANKTLKREENEENIDNLLKSEDQDKILLGINLLKDKDISEFIPIIKEILVNSNLKLSVRCLALILLSNKGYKNEVNYLNNKKIIKVVPNKIEEISNNETYNTVMARRLEYKDSLYEDCFERLLFIYYLFTFPEQINDNSDDLFTAMDIVTRRWIKWPENKMRQKPNVERLIKEIEEANRTF